MKPWMTFLFGILIGLAIMFQLKQCASSSQTKEIQHSTGKPVYIEKSGSGTSPASLLQNIANQISEAQRAPGATKIAKNVQYIAPNVNVDSTYKAVLKDSNIHITGIAHVKNCQVTSIDFEYSFFEKHQTDTIKEFVSDPQTKSAPQQRALFLTAEPVSDGSSSGLSLGVLAMNKKLCYGIGYDPFLKNFRAIVGFKIFSK